MSKLDNIKIPDDFNSAIDMTIEKALRDKNKLNLRKRKSLVAGLSGILVIGTIALSSESTWAYIENFTKHIESFFGRDRNTFDKYKFEVGETIENNGLKFTLGEVMLDDEQLIISICIDYADFDEKGIYISDVSPSVPTITIDGIELKGLGGGVSDYEKVKGEKKNSYLIHLSFSDLHSNQESELNTLKSKVLDTLNSGKDCDLKINFGDVYLGDREETRLNAGNWEFNTKINYSNIIKDTKVHKINKEIKMDEDLYKGTLTVDEVRISPLSVKIKYNFEVYTDLPATKRRDPVFMVKNQYGKKLDIGSGDGGEFTNGKYYISNGFQLKGNEKKITIIPYLYINDKEKLYLDDAIELSID